MKKIYKTAFQLATAVIFGTAYSNAEAKPFNIFDHTFSINQQGGFIMSQNDVNNTPGMWDKTKDVSHDAWEATKDGTEKAWDKTKDVSHDAWEATKDGTEKAWDKTKDVSHDAWEATKDGTEKAWDKTKDVSHDAWDATKEGAEKAKDAVTGD